MKVLILFAHPAFDKSRVNRLIVEGLSDIEGVTFHDLYQEYPEFYIDVEREQQLMEEHDVIIFQFPLFWYSTPALLKEWQDLVLQHGWAFGSQGNALKDKLFMCSMTVGGPRKSYQIDDFHDHTLNELLAPLRQTAKLCKMKFLPPFAVHGSHGVQEDEVLEHKEKFLRLLDFMINDNLNPTDLKDHEYMNDFLAQKEVNHGG
ncbi:MAG: NAD(P)H-dependent oxidoreductase [Bacteroidota bacterium]